MSENTKKHNGKAASPANIVSIFMTGSNPDVVPAMALLNTACAKSVCGRPWAQDVIQRMSEEGIDVARIPESEPCRFGPGKRILSEEALLLPVVWGRSYFHLEGLSG